MIGDLAENAEREPLGLLVLARDAVVFNTHCRPPGALSGAARQSLALPEISWGFRFSQQAFEEQGAGLVEQGTEPVGSIEVVEQVGGELALEVVQRAVAQGTEPRG